MATPPDSSSVSDSMPGLAASESAGQIDSVAAVGHNNLVTHDPKAGQFWYLDLTTSTWLVYDDARQQWTDPGPYKDDGPLATQNSIAGPTSANDNTSGGLNPSQSTSGPTAFPDESDTSNEGQPEDPNILIAGFPPKYFYISENQFPQLHPHVSVKTATDGMRRLDGVDCAHIKHLYSTRTTDEENAKWVKFPINKLPPELLASIFCHATANRYHPQLLAENIASTCSKWRSIAMNGAKGLWTKMTIPNADWAWDKAARFLERSGRTLPLRVQVLVTQETLQRFTDLFTEHIHRLEELFLITDCPKTTASILEVLQTSAPKGWRLKKFTQRTLHPSESEDSESDSEMSDVPAEAYASVDLKLAADGRLVNLQTLAVDNPHWIFNSNIPKLPKFSSLTSLTIYYSHFRDHTHIPDPPLSSFTATDLVTMLACTPALVDLHIFSHIGQFPRTVSPENRNWPTVDLPYLRHIRFIRGGNDSSAQPPTILTCADLLDIIRAPNLESLVFRKSIEDAGFQSLIEDLMLRPVDQVVDPSTYYGRKFPHLRFLSVIPTALVDHGVDGSESLWLNLGRLFGPLVDHLVLCIRKAYGFTQALGRMLNECGWYKVKKLMILNKVHDAAAGVYMFDGDEKLEEVLMGEAAKGFFEYFNGEALHDFCHPAQAVYPVIKDLRTSYNWECPIEMLDFRENGADWEDGWYFFSD